MLLILPEHSLRYRVDNPFGDQPGCLQRLVCLLAFGDVIEGGE